MNPARGPAVDRAPSNAVMAVIKMGRKRKAHASTVESSEILVFTSLGCHQEFQT
jgi:hypothetical protein